MIKFLCKGVIRDRSRSLLPAVVVAIGVFVIVVMSGLMDGMKNNMINTNANFSMGHVKVMTRAYEKEKDQQPLDLALLGVSELKSDLQQRYPDMDWCSRITYGVVMDIPDDKGESRGQAPVVAMAYDFLSEGSSESERIGLERIIIDGHAITQPGQVLVSKDLAERFNLKEGTVVTLFGADMNGSMSFDNLKVAGVVSTGISRLDHGCIITDMVDARRLLDMEDATTMLLGFERSGIYNLEQCENIKQDFNAGSNPDDEYAPIMLNLIDQEGMGEMVAYVDSMIGIMMVLLISALSLVLWNTGVLGGIRRYGEFGVRLAIGESKRHIVFTLLVESFVVGVIGAVVGTFLALMVTFYIQKYGIDYSQVLENMSVMMNPIVKSQFSPYLLYIGFIPGVVSILIGTLLASRAIFKRATANLFKELD